MYLVYWLTSLLVDWWIKTDICILSLNFYITRCHAVSNFVESIYFQFITTSKPVNRSTTTFMKWIRTIIKLTVLARIANFKARVKRIKHNSQQFFIVLFVILTLALLWFARPFMREGMENYRDGQRRAELPKAVIYGGNQQLTTNNEQLIINNHESSINPLSGEFPRGVNQQPTINMFPKAEELVVEGGAQLISHNLHIPFTPQAPHANWDMPYQEACEEASVYMTSLYFTGDERDKIPADEADAEILKLVEWQNERFGYYKDTTADEVLIILREYYKLDAHVIDDPSVEQIKAAVADGRPVIVPAYGKELPNPYFTGDGPLYHMLVIKGYTETEFITNDPGTRRGAEFTYKYDEVMNVIHDWNNGDVPNGPSRVIIVEGPF